MRLFFLKLSSPARALEVARRLTSRTGDGDAVDAVGEDKLAAMSRTRFCPGGTELEKARVIDEESISTETVAVGCRVSLMNLETNEGETFVLLGPWDADADQSIISYLSPLGRAILGKALGEEALRIIGNVSTIGDVPLDVATSVASLPRQKPSWTVDAARRQHEVLVEELGVYQGETWAPGTNTATAGMRNPAIYGNGLTQLLMVERQGMPPIRADLQAFKIGDLLISGSPGELFNELGTKIKRGGGVERTWVASYCSDYIGYISTRLPHDETAVIPLVEIVDQTRYRRYYGTTTSPFAPEAGEMLVAESIALLKKLS